MLIYFENHTTFYLRDIFVGLQLIFLLSDCPTVLVYIRTAVIVSIIVYGYGVQLGNLVKNSLIAFVMDCYFIGKVFIVGNCLFLLGPERFIFRIVPKLSAEPVKAGFNVCFAPSVFI